VREDVMRKPKVLLRYYDENFEYYEEEFEGLAARVIQHEYDHIEGKLFTDRLSSFKRTLLKGKLNDISKGNVEVDYKMKFPKK
jgi:peptide deformylase